MAAKFLAKNGVFGLSKAFPPPALSLRSSRKVSRVCLTYASKYSEGRNAAEESRDSTADKAYDSKDWRNDEARVRDPDEMTNRAKESMKEGVERSKEKAREMKDRPKEYAEETKEKAKEGTYRPAESVKERANDYAEAAKEKAKEGTYKAAETAESAKEKVKGAPETAKEKEKEGAHKAAETVKEGTMKAAEAVKSVGEKAKETAKSAWDAAKETGHKIKEMVVGPDGEVGPAKVEVEVVKAPPEDKVGKKTLDEDVVERRKRAGKDEKTY